MSDNINGIMSISEVRDFLGDTQHLEQTSHQPGEYVTLLLCDISSQPSVLLHLCRFLLRFLGYKKIEQAEYSQCLTKVIYLRRRDLLLALAISFLRCRDRLACGCFILPNTQAEGADK